MKYERFTERVGKSICIRETSTNDNKSIWNAIEYLAELEDKIENGTLIELPCKVGDKVYFETWEDNGSTSIGVQGHTVTGFEINFIINGRYGNTYIPTRAVGIDVFLTKAEAEAKLKELKGE